ncbi:MAG: domain containing protein [Bacteroidetes bacterium]|nr:domain containing protein [Bacteroidota bacterium]
MRLMKFLRTVFLAFLIPVSGWAQFNCGNTFAQERLFEQDPSARERFINVTQPVTDPLKDGERETLSNTSFTIPVVFHILHIGGNENISDVQVASEIAILNRDFQKKNADTANIVSQFKNLAANCNIQFSLATLDPNGNCTNGITRHYTTKTDWTVDMNNYTYTWPPSKYLNVYVVKTMQNGAAGYAYLPGTAPAVMDAIVILHNYVGSIGTGNGYTSRALTHEVGHWFNLQHTWGSTNNPGVSCGDDGVSDTPVTKGHSQCNLQNAVDCTPGVVENIQNYMEYAYCSNMYTQGQKTRMHNCLNSATNARNNLSTNGNLVATGVLTPASGCAPVPEFITSTTITCVGNAVQMTDYSYNGTVTGWKWSSSLASNTSTVQNGSFTFTNSGIASVKLVAGNSFGSDSLTKQIITVLAGINTGSINVVQGFESGTFPDNLWIASSPQYGSPFLTNSVTAFTGSNCVWVNNYFDNPNGAVSFYSPAFNLQTSSSIQLKFSYAYAQQSAANNDQLKVWVSTNCGSSWSSVFSSAGSALTTTGILTTGPFSPTTSADWRTVSVNLSSFSGNSKVYVKFEFTPDANGAGNNIFMDDINLENTISGLKNIDNTLNGIVVFPNPFSGSVHITNEDGVVINSVKFYDVSMRELKHFPDNLLNNRNILLNGLEEFKAGIYFIEIKTPGATKTLKLIKL